MLYSKHAQQINDSESSSSEEEDGIADQMQELEKFDGTSNVHDFISKVEIFARIFKWDPILISTIVPMRLTGNAKMFALLLKNKSWEEQKSFFIDYFDTKDNFQLIISDLETISQEPTDDVRLYIIDFREIVKRIDKLEIADQMMDFLLVHSFIRGLQNDNLKKLVRMRFPNSLNEAYRHAVSIAEEASPLAGNVSTNHNVVGDNYHSILNYLSSIVQLPTETLSAYFLRIQEIDSRIQSVVIREEMSRLVVLYSFIRGLRRDIGIRVRRAAPTTLYVAYAIAASKY